MFAIASVVRGFKQTNNKQTNKGKAKNANLVIVAEAFSKNGEELLKRSGVDSLVAYHGIQSCLLAQELFHPGINKVFVELITHRLGNQMYLLPSKWENISFHDLQKVIVQSKMPIQCIGICQQEKNILNPPLDTLIQQDDKLIVLAQHLNDYYKFVKQYHDIKPSLT